MRSPLFGRSSERRGYTAVEVLVAMTLFAIGAAGVIGMQKASLQGNADARRFDIGTGIANEWIARLRADAMTWTQPNAAVTNNNVGTNTVWLRDAAWLGTPLGANTGWLLPRVDATRTSGVSYAFDSLGREVAADSDDRFYCVNYRLDWLKPDPNQATLGLLMRAEVRVFWPRFSQAQPADCKPTTANGADATRFHFLYSATTIRRNAT